MKPITPKVIEEKEFPLIKKRRNGEMCFHSLSVVQVKKKFVVLTAGDSGIGLAQVIQRFAQRCVTRGQLSNMRAACIDKTFWYMVSIKIEDGLTDERGRIGLVRRWMEGFDSPLLNLNVCRTNLYSKAAYFWLCNCDVFLGVGFKLQAGSEQNPLQLDPDRSKLIDAIVGPSVEQDEMGARVPSHFESDEEESTQSEDELVEVTIKIPKGNPWNVSSFDAEVSLYSRCVQSTKRRHHRSEICPQ
jgi:hypothetical protein